MCKFVTGRLDLGKTRIAGYTAYDSKSKNILELVPTEAKSLVERGELYGLVLNEQGELLPDKTGFTMNNLFIKSGVGNWRTLYDNDSIVGEMFILVRVITSGENVYYELISNRGGRELHSAKPHIQGLHALWQDNRQGAGKAEAHQAGGMVVGRRVQ